MPIDDHLDTLSGGIWFSKLDAMSAYCHMQRKREDRKKVSWDCLAITESEVVQNWPVHASSNMGLVNYHQGCIKDFSEIATPLYAVTGKHQFVWNQDQAEAKESVRTATYADFATETELVMRKVVRTDHSSLRWLNEIS